MKKRLLVTEETGTLRRKIKRAKQRVVVLNLLKENGVMSVSDEKMPNLILVVLEEMEREGLVTMTEHKDKVMLTTKGEKVASEEKLLTRQEKKELLASKYGLDLKKMRYNNEGSSDVDSWVYSDGSFFICFANGLTFTPPSNQRQSA